MNKSKLIALTLLLALLLAACGQGRATPEEALQLWYPEDAPAAAALCALAEDYNAQRGRGQPALHLRALPAGTDPAALPAESLPELLLCSRGGAQSLAARGLLGKLPEELAPAYADGALTAMAAEGALPLGAAATLLCMDARLEAPADLEALLRRAADFGERARIPYCTADRFAPLFAALLAQRGEDFRADWDEAAQGAAFAELYNRFAEAAYARGLALYEVPAAHLVQAGQLSCALVDSPLLPGLTLDQCRLLPLPGIAPGEVYPAELVCLALCARESRGADAAEAFLGWLLQPGHWDALTRQAGLAPLRADYAALDDPLDAALAEIGAQYRPALPGDCRDYERNCADFEARLREILGAFA